MNTSPIRVTKQVVALDCPDAQALAKFYARLLGWRTRSDEKYPDWVDVLPPEGESAAFALACQEVPDYQPPQWPDGPIPQQVHLDLHVDSIAESAPLAEAAGAQRHEHQPSEDDSFLVFLDPVGHPFCLCEPSGSADKP